MEPFFIPWIIKTTGEGMENNKKLIAAIFEEQKVFITFRGDCYRYDKQQDGFRCFKMNKLSQKDFWENYRQTQVGQSKEMMIWRPVAYAEDDEPHGLQNRSEGASFQKTILRKLRSRNFAEI